MPRCRTKSAGIPVCGAISSACLASSSGSTSVPSIMTERSQVRWFRPTWPERYLPGLDAEHPRRSHAGTRSPRCTARPRGARRSSRARVTIPTGLVKSMMKAEGEARRRARSARSSTTGTVRSALASPPAPVVSCPTQPQSSGQVSSRWRAAWPPIRSWNKIASAPSVPSSTLSVQRTSAGVVVRGHDPGRHRSRPRPAGPGRGRPGPVPRPRAAAARSRPRARACT